MSEQYKSYRDIIMKKYHKGDILSYYCNYIVGIIASIVSLYVFILSFDELKKSAYYILGGIIVIILVFCFAWRYSLAYRKRRKKIVKDFIKEIMPQTSLVEKLIQEIKEKIKLWNSISICVPGIIVTLSVFIITFMTDISLAFYEKTFDLLPDEKKVEALDSFLAISSNGISEIMMGSSLSIAFIIFLIAMLSFCVCRIFCIAKGIVLIFLYDIQYELIKEENESFNDDNSYKEDV